MGGLGAEPPASESNQWMLGGEAPPPLENFGKKKAILMPLDNISPVFRAISKN